MPHFRSMALVLAVACAATIVACRRSPTPLESAQAGDAGYNADVEMICDGENASGWTLQKDMSRVTAYIRQHLGTPEGKELFSRLSEARLSDRAGRLQGEATRLGIASCPLVASYEKLAAASEYRSELKHLCSLEAFPHFGEADDVGRLQQLEDWIDQSAKNPRTKALAEPLRQATPAGRGKLLGESASSVYIFSCEVAKTFEVRTPPSLARPPASEGH